MTIREAITKLDSLVYNTYSDTEKREWLSNVDANIKRTVIDTHEGADTVSFEGYTDQTPDTTELLAPAPYDAMYLRWLESQIHYHNGENASYNASIILFNAEFNSFAQWYTRNHKPLSKGNRFIF